METGKARRIYNAEFKKNAVKLVLEEGTKASEVAKRLGIKVNILYKWIRQYKLVESYHPKLKDAN